MAEINIQRKKPTPSPWLLILLLLVVLGIIGYFLFRPGPETEAPTQPPPTGNVPAAPGTSTQDTVPSPDDAVGAMATEELPATPEELASFAANQTTSPDYARRGLQMLSRILVDLADRDDLQDAGISEKRDNLTSAISRLDEANASLRPGFVAAAALMQAMQQKAYPELERPVTELNEQAMQLSGRTNTADQQPLRDYFTQAAEITKTLNQPAS